MLVRFWGTRGLVPVSNPATSRHGGNTPCVQIRSDSGTLLVLDVGTGSRELGHYLERRSQVSGHILLTHTHWDHISGFPYFSPLFTEGNRFVLYGGRDVDRSLRDILAGQMHYTYHPVPLADLP